MSEQRIRLENETKVVGKILDVMKYCTFSGHMAQDVAIGQLYLQGLHTHMKAEVVRLAETEKTVQVVSDVPAIEVVKSTETVSSETK